MLVQFPPKRDFARREASGLFDALAKALACPIVCEPRHASWFTADVDAFLQHHRIARVAADPAVVAGADEPGGWQGLRYYRLHGSPQIYRSAYDEARLIRLATEIDAGIADGVAVWCVFDNTAAGAATGDALSVASRLTTGTP